MKVAGRADFYLQKPAFAKTANRFFGRPINDFQPDVLRRAWTLILEKLFIERLETLTPSGRVAINYHDKNRAARAVGKAFLASEQLRTYQLGGVLRKSFRRIGRRNRCCVRRSLRRRRWGDH